jgi:hypothetical protein
VYGMFVVHGVSSSAAKHTEKVIKRFTYYGRNTNTLFIFVWVGNVLD